MQKIDYQIECNKNHLVVGFGATGLSIVRALKVIGVNAQNIRVMDSRDNPPNREMFENELVDIAMGEFSQDFLDWCDYLWVSPGISIMTPELQTTIERLPHENIGGDIELFARLVDQNIIAITGTNGKSTVTTLTGTIIDEAGYDLYMGGNLGKPALDLWLDSLKDQPKNPLFVLELSSFQLETTVSLNADIGVILNISPDHLDRYRDYYHYIDSKIELFKQSKRIVIGSDNHLRVLEAYQAFQGEKSTFSLESSDTVQWSVDIDQKLVLENGQSFCSYQATRLGGLHNVLNIVAAVAITADYGISAEAIERGIERYEALPHRSLLVREYQGVRYYNDSKSTNIASTEAAINGFKEPKWLILGGVTKGQDFTILKDTLEKSDIKAIYLIGKSIDSILTSLPESIVHRYVETLDNAINAIVKEAEAGDIVLFSPACASFDQYANFEARGDYFIQLVSHL